ncbi:MAG: BrnT family toxin [Steroidobacteraceae bacterium]|jgi:uncharacterized DUF497 family protein
MDIRFEWDPEKARLNWRKHRVSFEMALRVFADPFQMSAQDRVEGGELRWRTIGAVEGQVVLLVAHAVAQDETGIESIRVISARRADSKEKRQYEQNRQAQG